MGQQSSSVTSGIKSQVDASSNPVYQLASMQCTGVLCDLASEVVRSGDVAQLDKAIVEKVTPFLYNKGEGAMMPVNEVISSRHKERTGSAFSSASPLQKFVCWRLDMRGAVGETMLHVCFLTGLPPNMKLLAQRLVALFPNIINDFYVNDEYYGETALHMGIVNEDAEVVRFLLRNGASLDVRCSGRFFTCEDQKDKRQDSANTEHAVLPKYTKYVGNLLYWGEYPLSFAACLSQEECFRMLCAYGADPNWRDTNGNTVLHICTIRENFEMFKLALLHRADLHIQNRQHLTPLTLSAFLAKKEMFDMIVKEEREHMDSIHPKTGEINPHSALVLVIYGDSSEHLKLLPNLLERLFRQLVIFTIYFTLMCACLMYRPTPYERDYEGMPIICLANLHTYDFGSLPAKVTVYAVLNLLVVLGAVYFLAQMYHHIRNVGQRMYFQSLKGFPAKAIFLMSCVVTLFSFAFRLMCMDDPEDVACEVSVLLTATYYLFFFRAFKSLGVFVLIMYKVIVKEISRFMIIYGIIVIGFSQSFWILFLGYRRNDPDYDPDEENVMWGFQESLVRMFIMSLTEFAVFFEQLEMCELYVVGKITFMVYMLLVTMLLMNMLIAMMTNTYTEYASNKLEYIRQFAAIILIMEQSFDSKARLMYQAKYGTRMRDGERLCLLLKQKLTDVEVEEERQEKYKRRRKFYEDKRRQQLDL